MSTNLQKTKLYFFLMALVVGSILFVFSYKWSFPGRVIRIPVNNSILGIVGQNGALTYTYPPSRYIEVKDTNTKDQLQDTDTKRYDKKLDSINIVSSERGTTLKVDNNNLQSSGNSKSTITNDKTNNNHHKFDTDDNGGKESTDSLEIVKGISNEFSSPETLKVAGSTLINTLGTETSEPRPGPTKDSITNDGPTQKDNLNRNTEEVQLENDVVTEKEKEDIRKKIERIEEKLMTAEARLGIEAKHQNLSNENTNSEKPTGTEDGKKNSNKKIFIQNPIRNKLLQLAKGVGFNGVNGMNVKTKHSDTIPRGRLNVTARPDACSNCFDINFKERVNEPYLCKDSVDLLIIITSTIENDFARNSIRKTWGAVCNSPNSKIKCVFFFGNNHNTEANAHLLTESDTYKDIVQSDFHDSYANLTYKTLASLKWSSTYCKKANYVMKTDDDMYINTELLPLLIKGAPDRELLGGFCWGPSSPHRDINSKWYVSYNQYSHFFFPAMCSGTGYIMSRDVVDGIIKMSANIPFFHLEDVYVAICAQKLGINPKLLAGFNNAAAEFEECLYRNRQITSHGFRGIELESIWSRSRTCPSENLTPNEVYRTLNM